MHYINLYQAHLREEKRRFSSKTLAQSALALVSILTAAASYNGWQIFQLRGQIAAAERRYALVKQQSSELGQQPPTRPVNAALAEKVHKLEYLLESQNQLRALLKDDLFAGGRGYSQYLVALARQHVAGLWLSGITLSGAGHGLTLRGHTIAPELLPRYLQNLAKETPLQGVTLHIFRLNRPEEKQTSAADALEFMVATADEEAKRP